jgi:hypothetical protein
MHERSTVMHKTYDLSCHLPAETAWCRIKGLLSTEGVRYTTTNLAITSVKTPWVVLGIQPELYSRRNWVGLNPFVFVSGIDVRFVPNDSGQSTVTVRVNRLRGILWVAAWMVCASFASRPMPAPTSAIVFVGVAVAAWLVIVPFLGGYLIKKEIADRLSDG